MKKRTYTEEQKKKNLDRQKAWAKANPEKAKAQWKRSNAKRDPEKTRAYNRNRKHKSPEKWLLNVSKARAKKNGIEHTIKESDISIPETCPVLGIKISPQDGKVGDNSATLDRVDSAKGYVPGNVRVISHRANRLKSDMTVEEVRKLLSYMERSSVSRL